jgi:hypothetical protein
MRDIEQHISPLIEDMFPSFYKEEGPNFIAFIKAYYEWMERSTQNLELLDDTGFDLGDTVSQTLDSGVIVTGEIIGKDIDTKTIIVNPVGSERFRCIEVCGVNYPISSSSGSRTFIQISTAGGVIYQGRKLFDYRDIDTTIDRFILNFKEKYLKNIQFDIATNKKLLVKNSLDLYRSKGTERSVDLFFKLIYGVDAEVYYPGDDLFKLSDGEWTRPTYLEVTDTIKSIDYVGKQIVGTLSGSSAFVERLIKRRVKDGVVSILYLSNISGQFFNNEPLGLETEALAANAPRVIGSLTSVEVVTGSSLFSVGDTVRFTSIKGDSAFARVTSVSDTTGVVNFDLIDGGWGYTTDANVYVSEKVLELSNVVTTNTEYFSIFEYLSQPTANIVFGAATGDFANGNLVYSYFPNNSVRGSGKIIQVEQTAGEPNGQMYITLYSGTFPQNANVFTTANTTRANVATYSNTSSIGLIIGVGNTSAIAANGATGALTTGMEIYQSNASTEWANAIVDVVSVVGSTYLLSLADSTGAFRYGTEISVRDSSITANVQDVKVAVGLSDIVGTFSNTADLYTFGTTIGTTANVISISGGFGATFEVGDISESETIFVNTDMLAGNNGLPPATDAYTDSFRRIMTVGSESGFANTNIVYQEYEKVAFNPLTAVNTTTGVITLPSANSHYLPGDTVRYTVASGNTAINDLTSEELYYVYNSTTTGVTLARRYDYAAVNNANFPNFANNLISQSGHFLSKMAYGVVTNTSVGSITTSGVYNGFSQTGGVASTTVYANGNIVLYSAPTTNTNISTISTSTSVSVSNQSYMSLPIMGYAFGFPKNIQGNIQDNIFSCLTLDQFTIGSIATLTGINPGADYNVDPFILVYQPYIASYGRTDYIIDIEDATQTFTVGERIEQTPIELTYYTLTVADSSVFSVGEKLYQGTLASPSANMFVTDIYTATSMRVNNVEGTIANTTVKSYATVNTTTISNNALQAQFITGEGIIKAESNTSVLYVKRINFEQTFRPGETITGVSSDTTATITAIRPDPDARYIGLNATVTGNVVTSNGTIRALEVTDSGFGYSNSEILTYTSEDGTRSGQAKAIVTGVGTGAGYYKSSKGFVSQDKYLIDSDYYQEYSYEVLSKLPFEKYAEMFKRVMHTGGTKVFGSVVLIENASPTISIKEDASEVVFQFNSNSSLTNTTNSIKFFYPRVLKTFNSIASVSDGDNTITVTDPEKLVNPFANGDQVLYYTAAGDTVLTGLANNTIYYVVGTSDSYIKLSSSSGGSVINIGPTLDFETHYLQKYESAFANGDVVRYSTAAANSLIQTNIVDTFTSNTGVVVDGFIKVTNNLRQYGDVVNTTFTGTSITVAADSSASLIANNYIPIASHGFANNDRVLYYTGPGNTAFSGLSNNSLYYVIQANSSHVRLATQAANTNSVVELGGLLNSENGHLFLKGISGLTSGNTYYVVQSNTSGIRLSKKTVPQYVVEFNGATAVSNTDDTISLTTANTYFANGDFVKYYTARDVRAVPGLANNQYYYIRNANTTVVKLSSTPSGSIIDLTSANTTGIGHFLINDYVVPFRSSNAGVTVTMTQTLLTNNGIYYCVNTVPTEVQLSRSLNGTAINITANGTSSGASTNGHYLATHI